MENKQRNYFPELNMPKIAIVRGKFLNGYEMQFFEPLISEYNLTAFGSLTCYHDNFKFPVVKLPSPMDISHYPYALPILNRLCIDAHYLFGLENKLKGFDLVHTAETYFHYTQQALNAKKRGFTKKVIATVLENIPFNNEGIFGRKQFKKRTFQELDLIIALTQRTRQALLLEGADDEKIVVLSHFVDTKRFFPDIKQQQRIQNEKNTQFTLLFCGRLESYKGIFELLYATRLLISDPDIRKYRIRLVYVGVGSEKKRLVKKCIHLGLQNQVFFENVPYDQMPDIYKKADMYIAPSKATSTYQEQYNTTLLEAQAMGLPIVTTASGGIIENVGNAAIVVQQADILSLKEAMKKYLLNPKLRDDFAKRARLRAVNVHDITVGSSQLAEIYKKVLS